MKGLEGSSTAVPDEIRPLLDAVFAKSRITATRKWITFAPWEQWKPRLEPWKYFCGLCDSTVGDDDFVTSSLRRSRFGRRLIECHGVHWSHDFERLGLPMSVAVNLFRPLLEGRMVAATWDIPEQKLLIAHGRKVPNRT